MQQLVEEIRAAFEGAEPPADDRILHPDCRDDVDILEFYGGVRWQDMTDENVIYSYAAPTAFSAEAFRYYLPAFLIWTLKNLDSVEYASESILLALDPGTDKELLHDFRKSKFDAMTPDQVAVVRKFLWHVSEHDHLGCLAEQALINHWMDA